VWAFGVFFYVAAFTTDWLGEILPITHNHKNSEPDWLRKQCTDLRADWLLLDGYQFDQDYRQSLRCNAFKFAVFDDMNNSGALHADMVINGALNANLHRYQLTAPKALLAVGRHYQVLRQEFLQITNREYSNRKNLTIVFGGSDPKNLTIMAIKYLCKVNASMPINIITGAAYDGLTDLAEVIKSSGLDITHLHDCQSMAEELVNTKLALSAAGGSQFELLACATPSILVVVAENQTLASQNAATQGWCQVVNSDTSSTDEWVRQGLFLWEQPERLVGMHQKALLCAVFDGAKNIVELMSEPKKTSENT
jgi:UDP-2,4-diacetamido-2,4,6-trideoxy-beta-L-altropyranose hydrolase